MAESPQKMSVPRHLDAEGKAEWRRCVAELAKLGRTNSADRAILTVHCQAWSLNRTAFNHVDRNGMSTKYSNGTTGPTPEYRALTETTKTLRGTLADLGLTPAARNFDRNVTREPPPLED